MTHDTVLGSTHGFARPSHNTTFFGIEPGMHVADFGAGSGVYVHEIAKALAHSGRVYAIDVQRDLLRRIKNDATRHGYKNVDVIWSDLEHESSSKLANHSIDRVLISNVLFQLQHKDPVFVEAHRILKPNGTLIIIDWSDSFGGLGPVREDVITREEAHELAESHGFELIRFFDAGTHHYGIILKKASQSPQL